jgi:hypothetical protein
MGFFDLVNVRSINKKLGDLMPVVEANLSRLTTYFDNHFKVKKKYNNSFYMTSEPEEIIETTQEQIDELLRLKEEFESEFVNVQEIVQKIKPITFLDDDRSYVHWNNKLVSIGWTYDIIIKKFNSCKIYIKK